MGIRHCKQFADLCVGDDDSCSCTCGYCLEIACATLRAQLAEVTGKQARAESLLNGAMAAAITYALACPGCKGERCEACEPVQKWIDDTFAYLAATPKEGE